MWEQTRATATGVPPQGGSGVLPGDGPGGPLGSGPPGAQMPAAADRSRLIAVRSSVALVRAAGSAAWPSTGTTTSR